MRCRRLVQGSWRDRAAIVDTLDWEQFRKSRAKELVAARDSGQQLDSTEIKVVIARFNLVANWCSSEVSRFLVCSRANSIPFRSCKLAVLMKEWLL